MRILRGAITVLAAAILFVADISARPRTATSGKPDSDTADNCTTDSGTTDSQSAGPRTTGAVFSFYRTGIEYGHTLKGKAFWNIGIGVEYGSSVFYRNQTPGVSLDFVYNYILRNWKSAAGEAVLYAGPGLKVGYGSDGKENAGLILGLIGNLGFDFRFQLPVTISVAIKPSLGLHLRGEDNNFSLGLYRNGLILGLTPEVGIKYSF